MSAAGAKAGGGGELALLTTPITFPTTVDEIGKLRTKYRGLLDLDASVPENYEALRVAGGELCSLRTAVEARRVDLKNPALVYGRKVDETAKGLIGLIVDLEDPIVAKKKAVDATRAKAKQDAERAELLALEAKIKADREAEEARAKNEAADREAKLAAERAIFEEQKRKADEERVATEAILRGERARLEAEAAAVAEQKRALHDRELAAARADKERKDAADREEAKRLAAIQAEKDAAEAAARAALDEARLEALRPDVERVHAWGRAIADFVASAPTLESDEGAEAVEWGRQRLLKTADFLEKWQPGGAA